MLSSLQLVFAKIIISPRQSGLESMSDKLAEVEISKDGKPVWLHPTFMRNTYGWLREDAVDIMVGEIYFAKVMLPSGEVITLENEDFEEVLEQVANDLQERYSN